MQPRNKIGEFAIGMTWVWILNLLAFFVLWGTAYVIYVARIPLYDPVHRLYGPFWIAWLAAHLTQIPYAIPLGRYFRRHKRSHAVNGAFFGAVVTAIGYCALVVWLLHYIRYMS